MPPVRLHKGLLEAVGKNLGKDWIDCNFIVITQIEPSNFTMGTMGAAHSEYLQLCPDILQLAKCARKNSACLCNTSSREEKELVMNLISDQFNLIRSSQLRPRRFGPVPGTTSNGSVADFD